MLVSQTEAMDRVAELVDDEEWRSDKRHSWWAILRQLVRQMDWDTGLITAVTAERLGAAGGRAPRTVSRVLAWARDVGLLVVVEAGASAEFLGAAHGRTPTYALVTTTPPPPIPLPESASSRVNSLPVDESGDLPTSSVGTKPLTGGRRTWLTTTTHWPTRTVPDDPGSRNAATLTLLTRLGLGGRKSPKIEIWRARALLTPWWEAGASISGLLYALEHHPDRPNHRRGDITQGARDPLRIIGGRLRPWQGRLRELPASAVGFPRASRARTRIQPERPVDVRDRPAGRAARQAARDALHIHLEELRQRRLAVETRQEAGPGEFDFRGLGRSSSNGPVRRDP